MKISSIIPGTWRGRYAYDSSVVGAPPGVFTMRLTKGWWFGRIRGVCIDHDPVMSSEPSMIVGSVKGLSIKFEKRYRTAWVFTEKGATTSTSEWLAKSGLPTKSRLPGHVVTYEGVYHATSGIIHGKWSLRTVETIIRANDEDLVLPSAETSGTWTMQKVSGA